MNQRIFKLLPNLDYEEVQMIDRLTGDLSDEQLNTFASIYNSKRKSSDTILLTCLLGLIVVAGVHRIILNQVGMGILYIFTGGLCLVGTIVDAVNYKKLTLEYNSTVANETFQMTRSMQQ